MLKFATKHDQEELKRKAFNKVKAIFPGGSVSDELIEYIEKLEKLVAAKKSYDERIKLAEEDFQRVMSEAK